MGNASDCQNHSMRGVNVSLRKRLRLEILYWYHQARIAEGHSSLPQALDELVNAIEPKALVDRIADVHRNVLRVELVLRDSVNIPCTKIIPNEAHPKVPAAR
jgi:hypothetical protein